jgi:hypothetical protein
MDKKGDYKFGIILSLVLGLMVLVIAFSFIFQEGIFGDDGMEVCRQSIQLRALLPPVTIAKIVNLPEFRDAFPLECKTMVKTISKENIEKDGGKEAQVIIAESIAECWALYDKGDASAFPSDFYGLRSTCVPCARIHLSEDARAYMEEKNLKIDIRESLDLQMDKDFKFYNYLENSGKKFPALNPASSLPVSFNLEGEFFSVNYSDRENVRLFNRLTGGVKSEGLWDEALKVRSNLAMAKVDLPRFFYHDKGDLIISYGIAVSTSDEGIGNYIPYMFYFQSGQNPNPFQETKKDFLDGFLLKGSNFCDGWEGV